MSNEAFDAMLNAVGLRPGDTIYLPDGADGHNKWGINTVEGDWEEGFHVELFVHGQPNCTGTISLVSLERDGWWEPCPWKPCNTLVHCGLRGRYPWRKMGDDLMCLEHSVESRDYDDYEEHAHD